MRSLVTWAIRNTPSMNTLMVAALAVGIISMSMLHRERFPEHRPDEVEVRVVYPGASPTETEEGICLKVEEAIRSVVGIDKLTSQATEGRGIVIAELVSDIDDLTVRGEAEDDVGIATVTVNGQDAAVGEDGGFSTSVTSTIP